MTLAAWNEASEEEKPVDIALKLYLLLDRDPCNGLL